MAVIQNDKISEASKSFKKFKKIKIMADWFQKQELTSSVPKCCVAFKNLDKSGENSQSQSSKLSQLTILWLVVIYMEVKDWSKMTDNADTTKDSLQTISKFLK